MAKNTGIERSKKNPIELGKRGVSCIFDLSVYSQCIFNYMKFNTLPRIFLEEYDIPNPPVPSLLVLLGFNGHDTTSSLM